MATLIRVLVQLVQGGTITEVESISLVTAAVFSALGDKTKLDSWSDRIGPIERAWLVIGGREFVEDGGTDEDKFHKVTDAVRAATGKRPLARANMDSWYCEKCGAEAILCQCGHCNVLGE